VKVPGKRRKVVQVNGPIAAVDPDQRAMVLAQYIVQANGNVSLAAFLIGLDRKYLYDLFEKYRLWPVINEVRRRRSEAKRMGKKHGIPEEQSWGLEDE